MEHIRIICLLVCELFSFFYFCLLVLHEFPFLLAQIPNFQGLILRSSAFGAAATRMKIGVFCWIQFQTLFGTSSMEKRID